jgi:hypothetical protein
MEPMPGMAADEPLRTALAGVGRDATALWVDGNGEGLRRALRVRGAEHRCASTGCRAATCRCWRAAACRG